MNTRLQPGRLIAAASGFVMTATLAAAPADPWSKVPALPTGCYSAQDQFAAKNEVAIESLTAEAVKQEEINQKIADQLGGQMNADPMQVAARMQEMMMKDPQAAMKYMETMGATDPQAMQNKGIRYSRRSQEMQAEEKVVIERYKAAVSAGLAPARAKFAALRKKLGITEGWGVGETAPAWAYAEYDAVKREADKGYEAVCSQWFGASGRMQAFLVRYKDYLVKERIPADEEGDTQKLANYAMSGIAADSYRSTVKHRAVEDYMKLAGRLHAVREAEPLCTGDKCRDVFGI